MSNDWQTWVTLAAGALSLAYVSRRWWPGLKGLFTASKDKASAGACAPQAPSAAPSSCGQGCGQCGQVTAAARDHRVHIQPRHTPQ